MANRLIIINRMYAGDFFNEKENIGGEVINLLRADNRENYIWLNPHGKCDPDIINKYDEIYVLLVRRHAPWKWKILGKAKIDKNETLKFIKKYTNATTHEEQRNYIKKHKISYGKTLYSEITRGNTYNGESCYDNALFFTFKSEKIWVPNVKNEKDFKNTIFNVCKEKSDLYDDDSENSKNQYKKGLTPRPLFMFLHYNKESMPDSKQKDAGELLKTYSFINEIIGDDSKSEFVDSGEKKIIEWKELPQDETADKLISNDDSDSIFKDYFLKVIREEDRELAFSNMLAYFLRENDILNIFVKDVLKIDDFSVENVVITREEANIDILITSESHKIILENKIKSNLIHKYGGMKTKLDDYFKNIKKGMSDAEKVDEINNALTEIKAKLEDMFEQKHLQTDRYYAYALSRAIKEEKEHRQVIKGFVLVPNYNYSLIESELTESIFAKDKQFDMKIITYKDVYDVFSKSEVCLKAKYMNEFLDAIKKHTKDVDNYIEEETKYNFCKKIKEINGKING